MDNRSSEIGSRAHRAWAELNYPTVLISSRLTPRNPHGSLAPSGSVLTLRADSISRPLALEVGSAFKAQALLANMGKHRIGTGLLVVLMFHQTDLGLFASGSGGRLRGLRDDAHGQVPVPQPKKFHSAKRGSQDSRLFLVNLWGKALSAVAPLMSRPGQALLATPFGQMPCYPTIFSEQALMTSYSADSWPGMTPHFSARSRRVPKSIPFVFMPVA